jgi:hypothetical protein
VPDHYYGPFIEKPFLPDPLYVHTLFLEKFHELVTAPLRQFEDNVHIQGIIIKIGFTLVNYRNDISPDIGYRFESSNQLAGRILHLEFHGNLHGTTCQVVERLSR